MFLDHVMPFCPLWSSAFDLVPKRLSNAVVENHFKQVKEKIPQNKRETYAEFISSRYCSVKKLLPRLVSFWYFFHYFF